VAVEGGQIWEGTITMHAAGRQDHAPRNCQLTADEAVAAARNMEAKVAAAIDCISDEPGRGRDLRELGWFSAQLCEVRQALEERAEREFSVTAAYEAGVAAGMARAAAKRRTAARSGRGSGDVTVLRPSA
jgi:hypothetical protein